MKIVGTALTGLTLSFALSTTGSSAQDDSSAGELMQAQGWEIVRDNCTRCHSSQIIVQNSGNREVWKSRIEWMQDSQGLGVLSPEVEDTILDYLSSNYGQKIASRRPALPAHLMPPNTDSQ